MNLYLESKILSTEKNMLRAESREYTRDVVAQYKDDQWTKLDPLLQPRRAHGSIVIGNKLFMIGGNSGAAVLS